MAGVDAFDVPGIAAPTDLVSGGVVPSSIAPAGVLSDGADVADCTVPVLAVQIPYTWLGYLR